MSEIASPSAAVQPLTVKRGRAALLSSVAMAAVLLALQPGTAQAQAGNEGCAPPDAGGVIVCTDNTDGIAQTGSRLTVANGPGVDIEPAAGTAGIVFTGADSNPMGTLANVDMAGATVRSTNADGVVVENTFNTDKYAGLDMTGDVAVTTDGSATTDPVRGVRVVTDRGTAVANVDGDITVTPGAGATNGTRVVGLEGVGRSVTLTATGDITVTSADGAANGSFVLSGNSDGVFVDATGTGNVVVSTGDIAVRSGSTSGPEEAYSGSARGVATSNPYSYYGEDQIEGTVAFTTGAVTVASGNGSGARSGTSGSARGFELDNEVTGPMTIRSGALAISSGNGTGTFASSGQAFGIHLDDEVYDNVTIAVESAAVSTGSATGVESAYTGVARFIELDDEVSGDVSITAGAVSAISGNALVEGPSASATRNSRSGDAVAFDFDDDVGGNVVVAAGDITAVTGSATARGNDARAYTGNARVFEFDSFTGGEGIGFRGDVSVSAGTLTVRSGDALTAGGGFPDRSGNTGSGGAYGIDVEERIAGDLNLDLAGLDVSSGNANGKYASSGRAVGIFVDGDGDGSVLGDVGVSTGDILVSSGSVSGKYSSESGEASGIEFSQASLGSVSVTTGAVAVATGDAITTGGDAVSGRAAGVSTANNGGDADFSIGSIVAASGNASAAGEGGSAVSGEAAGLTVRAGGSTTISAGSIVVSSGNAGAPQDRAVSGSARGVELSSFAGQDVPVLLSVGDIVARSGNASGVASSSGPASTGIESGSSGAIVLRDVASVQIVGGNVTAVSGNASDTGDAPFTGGFFSSIAQSGDARTIDIEASGDLDVALDDVVAASGSVSSTRGSYGYNSTRSGYASGVRLDAAGTLAVRAGNIGVASGNAAGVGFTRSASAAGAVIDHGSQASIVLSSVTVAGGDATSTDEAARTGDVAGITSFGTGDVSIDVDSIVVAGGTARSAVSTGNADTSTVGISSFTRGSDITIRSGDVTVTSGRAITYDTDGAIVADERGFVAGIAATARPGYADGEDFASRGDIAILVDGDMAVEGGEERTADTIFGGYSGVTTSAGIVAVSQVDEASVGTGGGSVGITFAGGSLTTNGQFVDGIVASSSASTINLDGSFVQVNGPGANGIIVASQIVDLDEGGPLGLATSQNLVRVGQGSSVIAEDGIAILDLDTAVFDEVLPAALLANREDLDLGEADEFDAGTQDPESGAILVQAANNTVVEIAGRVRGGPVDGSGTAISLGLGDDAVVIEAGYDITGLVDAGEGSQINGDVLALGGTGIDTFDFSRVQTPGGPTDGLQYVNFERFQKQGTSTFTVTGTNAGTFQMPVLGGTLLVDGTLANAAFPVSSGGTLGGIGTVGSFVAASGSRIAPGNAAQPFGTLTTTGAATFEAGSIFAVRLDDTGLASRLDVGGQTTIEGGTIDVTATPGEFATPRTYTVISSPTGVAGRFGGVVDNLPDLDFTDIYTPDSVLLGFTVQQQPPMTPDQPPVTPPLTPPGQPPVAPFSDKTNALAAVFGAGNTAMNFAETIGQRARLEYPQAAPVAAIGYAPTLLGYATPVPRTQLPSMSAVYGADLPDGGLGSMPIAAAAPAPEAGYGVWAAGFGERTDVSSSGGFAGYRGDSAGVAAGLEARMGGEAYDLVVGLAGGYSESDVRTLDGRADIDGGHVGVYALYENGPLTLTGTASYSRFDYDLLRVIAFGGGAVSAQGSADGDAFAGFAEAAYDISPTIGLGGVTVAPLARLRGVTLDRDGYAETGAGILNLTVSRDTITQVYGGAGVRLGFETRLGSLLVSPTIDLLYERNFSSTTKISNSAIADVPGATFATGVYNGDQDLFAIGAGLGLNFTPNLVGTVRYDGAFGSDLDNHRGSVGIAYRF